MSRIKMTACAYLIFAVYSMCAAAQNFLGDYVSRVWTAADGLPGNTITDIIQDRKGYIYIGTYDGLIRFDGVEFYTINKNTVKEFNCVSARVVYEDSRGNIWVGSNDEGVVKMSGGVFTLFTTEHGLPNNSIRGITEDKAGNIWIGTAGGVVYFTPDGKCVEPAGLEKYGEKDALIISLYCDTAGRVWISTLKTNGLYYYAAGTFSLFTGLTRLKTFTVSAITQDSTGAFWFGLSQKGAVRYDNGEIVLLNNSTGFIDSTVNCIFQDKDSALWFGTEKGLFRYKDAVFMSYTESSGLTNNNVKRVLEDREGNIWIATDRGGVEKLSAGKFRMQNLPSTVNCIAEDRNGFVWIGCDSGLYCLRGTTLVENDVTKACAGLRIRHLALAGNGDLLISTYASAGQMRAGENGIVNWTKEKGLTGDRVRVALEDKFGSLYIGTTNGLNVIDSKTGKITQYTRLQGLNNDYIMCLYEDKLGRMWVGTDGGGVNVIDKGSVTASYSSADGLAGNVIFKIMQDRDNVYWICTGTGISRFDGTSFINYNASCGLGTDSVFQMVIDYTDTVWMTSNRGISSVPLDDLNKYAADQSRRLDPKFFTKNDGLRSGGVTSTSLCMRDSIGRLWFTMIDGYAVYDPLKIKSNTTRPQVHVESVMFDEKKVPVSDEIIQIPRGTKRIDIKYTGLSFVSAETVRFKYMLEGFDKKYSAVTGSRSVSYTNLPPGHYNFSVFAANGDGLWSSESASVSFRLNPFFYQRISFWIIVAVFISASIVITIQLRLKRMMHEQQRLEKMVQIKTVDLQMEKDNSDRLLLNILPRPIADRLKTHTGQIIADKFDNVSVLFADIVGFTQITSHCSPEELVAALNELFTLFDERAARCGVEKIKTIGDCYMAVCGLPNPEKNHAAVLVKYACGMFQDLAAFNNRSSLKFQMRIGINSGTVIAGVIGKSKFIYDLWGDTVNVASRMESTGTPGTIHVSEASYNLAKESVCFTNESNIEVKGKGMMKTFYAVPLAKIENALAE